MKIKTKKLISYKLGKKMKSKDYLFPSIQIYPIEGAISILAGTDFQQSTSNLEEVEEVELGSGMTNLWDEGE